MIVVKIELWPFGNEEHKKEIGKIHITNDLTGTTKRGNYSVKLFHSGKCVHKSGVWRTGTVMDHLRLLSPYHLVYKAIKSALGREVE
jgi:hypothetical protein